MLTKQEILRILEQKERVTTNELVTAFHISRQYAHALMKQLVRDGLVIRLGKTRNAFYVSQKFLDAHPELVPQRFDLRLKNSGLEEHAVLEKLENECISLRYLSEHARNIFTFAFSEMLNNAIEHSEGKSITIELRIEQSVLVFVVRDNGIGVFRNVMRKKKLNSELEAIQDILKGKTTTIPHSHSGQGIFFTSRVADTFVLRSFDQVLIVDTKNSDVRVEKSSIPKRGTEVIFTLKTGTERHLSDVFREYTNLTEESDYGFDKTDIHVKLYSANGVNISRSQARRILHGLEKFTVIRFDYEQVPIIGQAFADEIYRVFHNKYPHIRFEDAHMNESIAFMVERAKTDARREGTTE